MTADDRRLQVTIHYLLAGIGYLSWRGWRRARLHMFEALAQAHELGDPARASDARSYRDVDAGAWPALAALLERADALGVPIADVPGVEHPDLQFARILSSVGEVDEPAGGSSG